MLNEEWLIIKFPGFTIKFVFIFNRHDILHIVVIQIVHFYLVLDLLY